MLAPLALAFALAADPQPAPPPAPAAALAAPAVQLSVPAAAPEASYFKIREFKSGAGLAQLVGNPGGAGLVSFGVMVSPWEHLAFNLPISWTYAGNWGDMNAVGITPGVVYRLGGLDARVNPYAGVGLDVSLLNIDPESSRLLKDPNATATLSNGLSAHNASASDGTPRTVGGAGGGIAQVTTAPEARAGVQVRLTRRISLDANLRYLRLPWGAYYHNAWGEQIGASWAF